MLEIWIPFFQDLCNLMCMGECAVTTYHWTGFYTMAWLGWGELGSDVGSAKVFALRNSKTEFGIDYPLAFRKYHLENAVLQFTLHRQKENLKNCTCQFFVTLLRECRSMFHRLFEISLFFYPFLKSGAYCSPELYLDTIIFYILSTIN